MISPVLSSDQGNDRYGGSGRTEDHDVVLQVLLLVLAAGLVVNSVLGPLILDVIDYSLSEGLRNQLVGLDAVSLVLVAPLCGIAALISRDRRLVGSALALGPAGYTVYMFVQYIVGPNYEHSPQVLPLHLGLFILGGVIAVRSWAGIEPRDLPTMTDRTRRIRRWILVDLRERNRRRPSFMTMLDKAGLR